MCNHNVTLAVYSHAFVGQVLSTGDANNHAVNVDIITEHTLDTLTIYTPVASQTDSDPQFTASKED